MAYYSNQANGHKGHKASRHSVKISKLLTKLGIRANSRDATLCGVVCQQQMANRVSVRVGHVPGGEEIAAQEAAVIEKFLAENGYKVSRREHIITVQMDA